MKYSRNTDYRKRRRAARRAWLTVLFVVMLLIAAGGYLLFENFKAVNFNSEEQTTSAITTSYIAPSIQVFRSPFFQFQTDKSWSEDPDASSDDKFVYRSLRNGLLEQQVIIYVNNAPPKLEATRVLPVVLDNDNGVTASPVSEHCGKASNYKTQSGNTSLEGVTFRCFNDSTRYTVVAGLVSGTPAISLPRPDGSAASYTIYYSNVTANPDANQFKDIVNTFQTR